MPAPPPRRTFHISDLTNGNESIIFAALGIAWPPAEGKHINCPFPDHSDSSPSWRWNADKRQYACSCTDPKTGRHGGDMADIIRRCRPDDLTDDSLGGIAKWLRALLERPIAAEPVRRAVEAKRVEDDQLAEDAANRARWLMDTSGEARVNHPYIVRKQIVPFGARQKDDTLLIPARDMAGVIQSCQMIFPKDGKLEKAFVRGSRVKGLRHIIGGGGVSARILFCEGWATGCSLHQATGLPVVVCFSAYGIGDMAKAFRERCPNAEFILAADNDPAGIKACDTAAAAVGNARVVIAEGVGAKGDFNDVHVTHGLAEVARQIWGRQE